MLADLRHIQQTVRARQDLLNQDSQREVPNDSCQIK